MAKLKINGRELLVKPITKARNRDLIELQVQTGLKMTELMERAKASESFAQCVVSFLAQHNAGFTVKWDAVLDGSLEDLGEFIEEPGDTAKAEAEAEANPTRTDSGTPETEPETASESTPE